MRRLLLAVVVATAACGQAEAQQPGWDVSVPDRVEVAIGGSAVVPIAIKVDRGLTVSKDAPVIVDLVPEPGIAVKKRRLGRADAVDPEADAPRFTVAVKAEAIGDLVVKVRLRLWICGGKVCRPIEVRRQATIAVAGGAAGDAGTDAGLDAGHRTP